MNTSSPETFLERLNSDGPASALTLTGMAKPLDDKNKPAFHFSIGDCQTWTEIPLEAIESAQVIGSLPCDGDHSHAKVQVVFKPDNSWTYQLLIAMADAVYRAGQRRQQAVAYHASEACLRCLDACQQITYPPEDPFGAINCMLRCAACP